MYATRTLLDQPQRLALTVAGVALCVVLMLFLLSIHRGVAVGSLEYVRASGADLWVLQRHAANILRSTSLLAGSLEDELRADPGVEAVAPVLFLLGGVETPTGRATAYFTGFDPVRGAGGPPRLAAGRSVTGDDEIVLDRAFAAKHRVGVGDRVVVNGDSLRVVGLSAGTNMFVVQYAFVSLRRAWRIAGYPRIASVFQVVLRPAGPEPSAPGAAGAAAVRNPPSAEAFRPGARIATDSIGRRSRARLVADRIRRAHPGVAVYDRATFIANNEREMESGVLPLIFVVAVIGAVVLTAILSLILSVHVLERRRDLAVMKALGAPDAFIPGLVLRQALLLASGGTLLGIAAFFPVTGLVQRLAPEVTTMTSPWDLLAVAAGTLTVSLLGAVAPVARLRHVYPLEVFR